MAIIFSGKQAAIEREKKLKRSVRKLMKDDITPKLVSLILGNDPKGKQYLSLKKKAAERIGAKLEILRLPASESVDSLIGLIRKLNTNENVHGIMLQLPLPSIFSEKDRDEIIHEIVKDKDIDGMRDDSMYLAPVVKSVLRVLSDAYKYTNYDRGARMVVVGADGFVGKKLIAILRRLGYKVKGVDENVKKLSFVTKSADILISATGVSGLINKNMVKEGAVVVDVGSPSGDVDEKEVKSKAKFLSPVPGGVGPLTIIYLLENLVMASSS